MKTINLLDNLIFDEAHPKIEALHADENTRIVRFALAPGQEIREHKASQAVVQLQVLQGSGIFTGGDGQPHEFGPNMMMLFELGENHSIQALDEPLVFVAFLNKIAQVNE